MKPCPKIFSTTLSRNDRVELYNIHDSHAEGSNQSHYSGGFMMKKSFVFAIIALFVAAGVFAAQAAPFAVNRRKKELDTQHTELTTLPYLKKASYAGLLAKAEKYEQEGKWVYAYGT